jgi:Trp operon repressor
MEYPILKSAIGFQALDALYDIMEWKEKYEIERRLQICKELYTTLDSYQQIADRLSTSTTTVVRNAKKLYLADEHGLIRLFQRMGLEDSGRKHGYQPRSTKRFMQGV